MEGIVEISSRLGSKLGLFELNRMEGISDGCIEVEGREVGPSIFNMSGTMTPILRASRNVRMPTKREIYMIHAFKFIS